MSGSGSSSTAEQSSVKKMKPNGPNKTTLAIVGGAAILSVGLLIYQLTRPTKPKTNKKPSNKPKKPKFSHTFKSTPIEVSFVMGSDVGFGAHVSADKKNTAAGLKTGAQLIRINGDKVERCTFEEVYKKLIARKAPITLQFRECPELEAQWSEAERLKIKGNQSYKEGKIAEGIDFVSKAIDLHPTNKVYYSNRVLMYLKTQQYEKALEDCQKIREVFPSSHYIKGNYLRGLVLLNLKRFKYAAAAFQTVMKLDPGFKEAQTRLAICEKEITKEREEQQRKRFDARNSLFQKLAVSSQAVAASASAASAVDSKEEKPAAEAGADENKDSLASSMVIVNKDESSAHTESPVEVDADQPPFQSEDAPPSPKDESQSNVDPQQSQPADIASKPEPVAAPAEEVAVEEAAAEPEPAAVAQPKAEDKAENVGTEAESAVEASAEEKSAAAEDESGDKQAQPPPTEENQSGDAADADVSKADVNVSDATAEAVAEDA